MSDELTFVHEALPVEAPLEPVIDARRARWFEVSLVLVIAFGDSFLGSLDILRNGHGISPNAQDSRWAIAFVHDLACLFLLSYILSRRRLRFKDLGLRWSFRDLLTGLLITVAAYLTYSAGYLLVHSVHKALFSAPLLAIPLFLLNPFFEEMIVRAYLMTEVRDLTGSWTLAIAVSVAIQFSYHLYYGWESAIALSFQFLVFSVYYAKTRKATPLILAHGIFDIYGLMRLW